MKNNLEYNTDIFFNVYFIILLIYFFYNLLVNNIILFKICKLKDYRMNILHSIRLKDKK